MSMYELRTIDGKSVLARVNAAAGVLEAAKTASMLTALNMLTAYTDLPYGFYDTFADGASVTLTNAQQSVATSSNAIPTMTSDTAPSGVCSASSVFNASFAAWKAADKVNSGADGWGSSAIPTSVAPQWWQYEYASATRITAMQLRNRELYPNSPATLAVYATNAVSPGTDYTAAEWKQVLGITTNANNDGGALLGLWPYINVGEYKKYRIVITARNGGNSNVAIGEVIHYPTMATRITPTGSFDAATIISTADTAPAAPSYAMGMVWLDADGATVTDEIEANNAIRLYFSRDNGATWDWLPLTDDGAISGDVRLYSCSKKLLTATSGTSIKLKLTSHDLGSGAPDFELHGWGCIYDGGA